MNKKLRTLIAVCGVMWFAFSSCSKDETPVSPNNGNQDESGYIDEIYDSPPIGGSIIIHQLSGDYSKYVPVRFLGGSLSYPGEEDASEPWVLDEGYYYSPSQWGALEVDCFINLTWEDYRNGDDIYDHYLDVIRDAKVTKIVTLPEDFRELAMERHPEYFEEKISYDDALKETMNWLIAEGLPGCIINDL